MVRPALNLETNPEKTMDNLIVGFISLGLLLYLLIAMIWPEKF